MAPTLNDCMCVSYRLFFTPNRALSGLALVGLPGTEGRLRIVAASQVRGQNIVLLIPFKLSQCPLGFYPPPGAVSLNEVSVYIAISRTYMGENRKTNHVTAGE